MPETVNPPASQQLDYDSAAGLMLDRVFAPCFFTKLAQDYGIAPANENEALELLQLADKIRFAEEQVQAKSASGQAQLIRQANALLDQQLGLQTANLAQTQEIKAAAARFVQDPLLRDAALLYQDAYNPAAA